MRLRRDEFLAAAWGGGGGLFRGLFVRQVGGVGYQVQRPEVLGIRVVGWPTAWRVSGDLIAHSRGQF